MSRPRLSAAVLVALVSLLPAACGRSSTSSSSTGASGGGAAHGLSVTPASGAPTTTFHLRFIAPASSAVSGRSRISYSLGVTGAARTGCIGATSAQVRAASEGDPVTIALDPATLGGSWCVGSHVARVLELQRPVCAPGTMCPQYVRVIGTVGTVTFRVTA